MQINKLRVKNFKTIEEADLSLHDFSVFIGKNNAGKSNIIKSIRAIRDLVKGNLAPSSVYQNTVRRNNTGESMELGCEFTIKDEKKAEIITKTSDANSLTSENVKYLREKDYFKKFRFKYVIRESGISQAVFETFGDESWFRIGSISRQDETRHSIEYLKYEELPDLEYEEDLERGVTITQILSTQVYSTIEDLFDRWEIVAPFRKPDAEGEFKAVSDLKPSGENLTTVLQAIQGDGTQRWNDIKNIYTDIMENVERIRISTEENSSGEDVPVIRVDEANSKDIELDELSSGSKEILLLVTQVVRCNSETEVVFFEEPELHLHPAAERRILQRLQESLGESGPQIILTTHSDVFVDNVDVKDVFLVKREKSTSIETVRNIGEALSQAGHPTSSYLQSDRVLFVEGRSDRPILENWSEIIDNSFARNGVFIRVFGGDEIFEEKNPYANAIPDMLSQMGIPYLYLFDNDGQSPEDKKERVSGEIEESPSNIHVMDRYCIESYLSDSPRAVAEIANASEEKVNEMFPENPNTSNMKNYFDNIFKEHCSVGYSEESHGAAIASKMGEDEIPKEMKRLISSVASMEGH